jgi:hypothetical protein
MIIDDSGSDRIGHTFIASTGIGNRYRTGNKG